jgi:hypothetical protein
MAGQKAGGTPKSAGNHPGVGSHWIFLEGELRLVEAGLMPWPLASDRTCCHGYAPDKNRKTCYKDFLGTKKEGTQFLANF